MTLSVIIIMIMKLMIIITIFIITITRHDDTEDYYYCCNQEKYLSNIYNTKEPKTDINDKTRGQVKTLLSNLVICDDKG